MSINQRGPNSGLLLVDISKYHRWSHVGDLISLIMKNNFYILEVIDPHTHKEWAIDAMEEVRQLIKTYGGEIIGESVQHAVHPHPGTYIGSGKLTQLIEEVKSKKIDVVVINDLVKSGQLFRLEKALWSVNPHIQVWDKVDLILRIFEKHATSTQAKLQIQLALIDHLGPRAYGLGGNVLSRQGAGIGTRGKGETNIEIERRRSRRIRQELVAKLAKIAKQHSNHIAQRKSKGVFTVALVGYTSAGKTTLFNQLTKKNKTFIEDRRADIMIRGERAGVFGELHPEVISNFGLEHPIIGLEIEL